MENLKNARQMVPAIERYVFSDKQDKAALADLIPGSHEDLYLKSLEALNGEKTYDELSEETKEMLEEMAHNKDGKIRNQLIHKRLLLRRFDATEDYKSIATELKKNHSIDGQKVKPPSFLKEMGAKGLVAERAEPSVLDIHFEQDHSKILQSYNDINKVHPIFRDKIDFTSEDIPLDYWFHNYGDVRAVDFDTPLFYKALRTYGLKHGFNELRVRSLTIQQIKTLMDSHKKLKEEPSLVALLFIKNFELSDSFKEFRDDCNGYPEIRAILKKMLEFLSPFSTKAAGSLRAMIQIKLLVSGVFLDKFDLSMLEEYVKRPISNKREKLVNGIQVQKSYCSSETMNQAIDHISSLKFAMRVKKIWKAYIAYILKHPQEIEEMRKAQEEEQKEGEDDEMEPKPEAVDRDDDQEMDDDEDVEESEDYSAGEGQNAGEGQDYDGDFKMPRGKKIGGDVKGPLGPLAKYFRRQFLESTIKELQFVAGEKVEIKEEDFEEYEKLNRERRLDFLDQNKEHYRPKDEVVLKVAVKNVPELLLRVFEINGHNYYREKKAPFKPSLNLEGLVPAQERVFNFTQPPQVEHVEEFKLPELAKRSGLFVIEFIGNGTSCRAVIRKGSLAVVSRPTATGHVAYIVDQDKKICKSKGGTTLTFEGKVYEADKDTGKIMIPYQKEQQQGNAILSHNGLSALTEFEILEEKYELSAAFLIHDEAFLVGSRARVLVRPNLSINGEAASLKLLKKIAITVELFNSVDRVPNTKTFDHLDIKESGELSVEFQVPSKLTKLKVKLSCQVTNRFKVQKLKALFRRRVNDNPRYDYHFIDGYLRLTEDGQYELLVLGKNGEPQRGLKLTLAVKNRYYTENKSASYQTDFEGKIKLGELQDIQWLEMYIPYAPARPAVTRSWIIRAKRIYFERPLTYELLQGEVCRIPVAATQDSGQVWKMYRVNEDGDPLTDETHALHFEKGKGLCWLRVEGLEPGKYDLQLKEELRFITLNVKKGKPWADQAFIETHNAICEYAPPLPTMCISKLEVREDEVRCVIENARAATQVHIFAFNFMPHQTITPFKNCGESNLHRSVFMETDILSQFPAIYLNSRNVSDQFRYVLERARLPPGIGHFLEKPTLLLKRQKVGDTRTEPFQLNKGQEYQEKGEKQNYARKNYQAVQDYDDSWCGDQGGEGQGEGEGEGEDEHSDNLNFLQQFLAIPAVQIFGVSPDKEGKVEAQVPGLSQYSTVAILAVNPLQVVQIIEPLPKKQLPKRDLSLSKPLDIQKGFTELRHAAPLLKHGTYHIEDISSTELSLVDSLSTVKHVLKDLAKLNASSFKVLQKDFGWVQRWSKMKPQQKLKKFGTYACHELNLFIKFRDPEFFEAIVRPYLFNKMEKSFMDYFLLEKDGAMADYYEQMPKRKILNPLELALLAVFYAKRGKLERSEALAALLRRMADKISVAEQNRCFDAVLKLSELKQPAEDQFQQILEEEKKNINPTGSSSVPNSDIEREEVESDEDDEDSSYRGGGSGGGGGGGGGGYRYKGKRMQLKGKKKGKKKGGGYQAYHYSPPQQSTKRDRSYLEKMGQTKKYAETHYYDDGSNPVTMGVYKVSHHQFWAAVADYALQHKGNLKGFADPSFIYHCGKSFTSQIAILTFLDIPEKASSHGLRGDSKRGLEISAASNLILLVKDIRETEVRIENSILVVQRYFDVLDQDSETEIVEFLSNKAYGGEVILTNVSSKSQECSVLVQIPQGALPLLQTQVSKSFPYTLSPYSTQRMQFYFYFPAPGVFEHFPANVSKFSRVVARAPVQKLKVVKQREVNTLATFADVLASGNKEAVLKFLEEKSLEKYELGFDFPNIYYLMKDDEAFWKESIRILKQRLIYDEMTWSYAVKYHDKEVLAQFFHNLSYFHSNMGSYFTSQLLIIDRFKNNDRWYDFSPLVNPRAHKVGNDIRANVTNRDQLDAYCQFLFALLEKPKITDLDRLQLVVYLLLQDRNHEAKALFDKIDLKMFAKNNEQYYSGTHKQTNTINLLAVQTDYLSAYFDFLFGRAQNFEVARRISKRYARFPIVSWRLMFFDIAEQLREYDGEEEEEEFKDKDQKLREAKRAKHEKKEEKLVAIVEGDVLKLETSNITQVTLKFYFVELEVLFSRQPFLGSSSSMREFSFVQPALVKTNSIANKGNETVKTDVKLPSELSRKDLVVEVSSGGGNQREFVTYFSTSLKANVVESYGELKVTDEKGVPLPGVYIKVFVRVSSTSYPQFYKDGYSDIRGKFDYAQFSGDSSVNSVKKFAILLTHKDYGSMTYEADPPGGVKIETKQKEEEGGMMMNVMKQKRQMKKKNWISEGNYGFEEE